MIIGSTRLLAACLFALPLIGVVAPARAAPNCASARTASDRVLCGDAALQALDRRMTQALEARLSTLSPAEVQALRADQRDWLDRRDTLFSTVVPAQTPSSAERSEVMAGWLQGRINFLTRIVPRPTAEPGGIWMNGRAEMLVTRTPDGTLKLTATGQDLAGKRWICSVQGRTTPTPTGLSLRTPGRVLRLTYDRTSVRVEDDRPGAPYCQPGGQMTGHYFRITVADLPGDPGE